jgi:multiple sugar transport system permease protein
MAMTKTKKKKKLVNYSKWGYFFIAPFFIVYFVFQFIPLINTFYYSFFENYRVGLETIGPNFVGLENYRTVIFESDFFKYLGNTMWMWLLGFLPQIIVSLTLALLFTSLRLKIKGQQFFKTVIYMPNLIMASAFAMLFFALFSKGGPINLYLVEQGILPEAIDFLASTGWSRGLIAFMNFLMWFGNTTILLMAGIMGIDQSLIEAAQIDGAKSSQVFFRVVLPLLSPILVYVIITSMIGGVQMFDIPQILTNGHGTPNNTTMTLVMILNRHLASKNYGMAGSISVLMFIFTMLLGGIVLRFTMSEYKSDKSKDTPKVSKKGGRK